MKAWFDTSLTGQGTTEDPIRPDLGGYEQDSDVKYSVMDRGDGSCLVCVTALPPTLDEIRNNTSATEKTDSEADTILMANRPAATLENVDVPDVELDNLIESQGLDPKNIRSYIQFAGRGNQVMQSQEQVAFHALMDELGVGCCDTTEGICSPTDPCEHCKKVLDGELGQHEAFMEQLRA